MNIAVRIKHCNIFFIWHFYPETPSNAIGLALILFIGWMPIDEVPNIFMDHSADPSIRSGVKLEAFFLFGLDGADFDFFAGDRAVDLIGSGLFDGLGDECLFWWRDDGEWIVKIVLWVVAIRLELWLHLLNYIMLSHIKICSFGSSPWSELPLLSNITYNLNHHLHPFSPSNHPPFFKHSHSSPLQSKSKLKALIFFFLIFIHKRRTYNLNN